MSQEPSRKLKDFAKYSGIAIQMGLTIYLASLLGDWLDQKYNNTEQLYTKIVTLIGVFVAMTSVILQVTKNSK